MKTLLGLFLLSASILAQAKTSYLILRASVPAVYEIKLNAKNLPEIHSNQEGEVLPKLIVDKRKNVVFVSLIHP